MERTHIAKVAGEDEECHRGSSLRDWGGCQEREGTDDVSDADAGTDYNLEADRLGKTTIRAQRRE